MYVHVYVHVYVHTYIKFTEALNVSFHVCVYFELKAADWDVCVT